jgi:hypothetical protein
MDHSLPLVMSAPSIPSFHSLSRVLWELGNSLLAWERRRRFIGLVDRTFDHVGAMDRARGGFGIKPIGLLLQPRLALAGMELSWDLVWGSIPGRRSDGIGKSRVAGERAW